MKRIKKISILLSLAVSTLLLESSVNANQIEIEVDIPAEAVTTFVCRCKHGGCYGGNIISFRSACAKNVVMCRDYDSNCP